MASSCSTFLYDQATASRHGSLLTGVTGAVLNLTNRCNLRCLHCFNGSGVGQSDELTDMEMEDVVLQLCAMKPYNVCFSGGEPLLRSGLLVRSATRFTDAGVRTSLVTNGCLISPGLARDLKRSGVAEVEVSIDGAMTAVHDGLRGVSGSLGRAEAGIRNLVSAGISPSISFTLFRENGVEFGAVCKRMAQLGAHYMLVRPMLPMGRALEHMETLVPTPLQYRLMARQVALYHSQGYRVWFTDPLNSIQMLRGQDCAPYVEIKANGALIATPYLQISFGNLRRHSLAEYWEAGLYRAWRLPAIARAARSIHCTADLARVAQAIPVIPPGRLSHFDLVDDSSQVWAGAGA